MRGLLQLAQRISGIFRHRRDARILAGLDAHMLADIGLNRADLRDAFSQPVWRDPTLLLETRAGERRTHAAHREVRLVPDQSTVRFPPIDRPARLHL